MDIWGRAPETMWGLFGNLLGGKNPHRLHQLTESNYSSRLPHQYSSTPVALQPINTIATGFRSTSAGNRPGHQFPWLVFLPPTSDRSF